MKLKIMKVSTEVGGVNMQCGGKYKIVCNDYKTYEGEYKGYNPHYNAIEIVPGMIPIFVDASYIKSVEAVE